MAYPMSPMRPSRVGVRVQDLDRPALIRYATEVTELLKQYVNVTYRVNGFEVQTRREEALRILYPND